MSIGRNAVLFQRGDVLRQVAARQDAAVHLRVQRLDAAVEHFRKAGVVGDFGHRRRRCRASSLAVPPVDRILTPSADSARAKSSDAGLVGNGNQSLFDHDGHAEK